MCSALFSVGSILVDKAENIPAFMDFDILVGRQRASEENNLQSDKAVENK